MRSQNSPSRRSHHASLVLSATTHPASLILGCLGQVSVRSRLLPGTTVHHVPHCPFHGDRPKTEKPRNPRPTSKRQSSRRSPQKMNECMYVCTSPRLVLDVRQGSTKCMHAGFHPFIQSIVEIASRQKPQFSISKFDDFGK